MYFADLLIFLGYVIEMRPCLYLLIESPARTLCGIALTVANQSIICGNVSLLDAPCQQIAAHVQCILGGQFLHKASNKANAQRYLVVTQGVSAHRLPAATLIDVAIAADEEVICNVIPAATLNVEALWNRSGLFIHIFVYIYYISYMMVHTCMSRINRTLIARFSELSVAVCTEKDERWQSYRCVYSYRVYKYIYIYTLSIYEIKLHIFKEELEVGLLGIIDNLNFYNFCVYCLLKLKFDR